MSKASKVSATIKPLNNVTEEGEESATAINNKEIKIGFILFNDTNPFFDQVVKGINNKAKKLEKHGVAVDIQYSELGDYECQAQLIDKYVKSGINGLAIMPVNNPLIIKKLLELKEKGIPVVTVNTDIENSGRIAYVGSNYYQSGKAAGNLMGLCTHGNARVGIITGSNRVLCHTERIAGFKDNIKQYYPGIKIVDIIENIDEEYESFVVTKKILLESPEIDALFLSAGGVYGACKAVSSFESERKLTIISYDAVPNTIKLVKKGVIAATIDQEPSLQGEKPLDILYKVLTTGRKLSCEYYYTKIEIKIRENV